MCGGKKNTFRAVRLYNVVEFIMTTLIMTLDQPERCMKITKDVP